MHNFKERTTEVGRKVEMSGKISRYIQLAKNVAYNSTYGKLRHVAVLVKGGSVLNTSFNKDSFTSFGNRFRDHGRGPATVHAEIGSVLGLAREATTGSDVYVCRINRKGQFRNSKPCSMCHEVLRHVGVKRVYYTTSENTIEMYKI